MVGSAIMLMPGFGEVYVLARVRLMLALLFWRSTLNVFSMIGLVMLMGLVTKNAILLVDFTNQGMKAGKSRHDAILDAGQVRLRPILMTSIATIMGAVPLVAFGGPGSASRATIGIVVIFGVAFSTLLSLFVVPAFYALLAKYTSSPEALAHELETLESNTPEAGGHA